MPFSRDPSLKFSPRSTELFKRVIRHFTPNYMNILTERRKGRRGTEAEDNNIRQSLSSYIWLREHS